jgi:transcriptional regulator with XRE-family HTH domain
MALSASDVRGIVERVCSRRDVLDACSNRDLGTVIEVLGSHGVTQGQIAGLTGLSQGRLSEYKKHKRAARATSTFEAFADGLGMPPAARQALGIASDHKANVDTVAQLPDELPSDVGLAYPDAPAEAAENVSRLWQADLDNAPLLQTRLEPGAWADASLRWLVDPGRRADREVTGGAHIGLADVVRFRATVRLFRQLDDRFGGGHARQSLIQYLSTDAERLLNGRYTEHVGRELYSATAEATLLAAWMSYDSAPDSSLAQRYFIQALGLAQAGDDRLLGASVLDAMSHQATYTGRFSEAANLARAARTGTRGVATPTLAAHFHTMEARALARLGDAKGCDHSLAEAVREFERRKPEDDPDWIRYFDESELAAEFGHCLRDLGRPVDAVQYASHSLMEVDETTFVRSDFFALMVLADAYLAAGETEKACSVALGALTPGEQLRSARCVGYLREFRQRLAATGDNRSIVDFNERAIGSRLWRIASRPG